MNIESIKEQLKINHNAYEFIHCEQLEDINSAGIVLKHKKSGARIALISNEDTNKVFSIGFRTPPADSTGVAHIIEHTVLCGSKNFPAKDPFIELAKGSLNTFLNAMTYPDKTVYPVASCNEKDFQNLMHVYMDAVFYPNIYLRKEIFEQEGWHYELESEDAELIYNGVVYNEMKGAFSSPESVLARMVQKALYPDTSYSVESGGDPDVVPELTYENYLEFHKQYYHPCNSYIYLYGDMDMAEKLEWLDKEYLSQFESSQVDSVIKEQPAFDAMRRLDVSYPLGENESADHKTYLSCAYSIGTSLDQELCTAFTILEKVLMSNPGAPLKQALLDANIGDDVISNFESEMKQPMLNITVKNSEASKVDAFLDIIRTTLQDIVTNGLDEKSLKATLSIMEFKYREADFGQFPKGLMYGLQMMSTWLYEDGAVFDSFHELEIFDSLRKKIGTRYFEDLIQTYILDNTHASIIVLSPEVGLNNRKEEALKQKLAEYKASLSAEEVTKLVEATKQLKRYQEEPSTKEELEKIPMLSREDIDKESMPLSIEESMEAGVNVLHHDLFTNGIIYMKLLFRLDGCSKDMLPYLGLLNAALGYVDTKKKSFLEFSNDVNIATGGIGTSIVTFGKRGSSKEYTPVLAIDTKVLYDQLPTAMELITEMLTESKLDDTKRMEEIVSELKSRLQSRLVSAGHIAAMERAFSYYSEEAYFEQGVRGIDFFEFLKDLSNNFETKKATMVEAMQQLMKQIFRPENLIVSITCPQDGRDIVVQQLNEFVSCLHQEPVTQEASEVVLTRKNEGFKISGQIQYVASVANIFDQGYSYTGALRVLKTILGYDYLWNNVRVKGGAYGCMCNFSGIDGNAYFVSYRDPNLKATKKVYEQAAQYVRTFDADEREMTKYIIGTMSTVDAPLTPAAKGARSLGAYMTGTTFEDIQKDRDEVLGVTVEQIRDLADLIDCVGTSEYFCVIGNENKIEQDKDLFLTTKQLL